MHQLCIFRARVHGSPSPSGLFSLSCVTAYCACDSLEQNSVHSDSQFVLGTSHCLLLAVVNHVTFNADEEVNVGPEGSIAATAGGSNTTVLLRTDLEPCAPNAVLHSIRSLLKPVDFVLPDSAAPRAVTAEGVTLSPRFESAYIVQGSLVGFFLLNFDLESRCAIEPNDPIHIRLLSTSEISMGE